MRLLSEPENNNRRNDGLVPDLRYLRICLCYKNIDSFYINPNTHALFCLDCCKFIPHDIIVNFERVETWHSLISHHRREVKCGVCSKLLLVYCRASICRECTERFTRGQFIIAQGWELFLQRN